MKIRIEENNQKLELEFDHILDRYDGIEAIRTVVKGLLYLLDSLITLENVANSLYPNSDALHTAFHEGFEQAVFQINADLKAQRLPYKVDSTGALVKAEEDFSTTRLTLYDDVL